MIWAALVSRPGAWSGGLAAVAGKVGWECAVGGSDVDECAGAIGTCVDTGGTGGWEFWSRGRQLRLRHCQRGCPSIRWEGRSPVRIF